MDQCRLSIAATGAFWHPLGDQTPIDCRYGETIDSVELPHRQLLRVSGDTPVNYGQLVNPRTVIVWNVSGLGLQVQPTEEEAAAIAAQVLLVGLTACSPGFSRSRPPEGGTTSGPPEGGTTSGPPKGGATSGPPEGSTCAAIAAAGTTSGPPEGGATSGPPEGGTTSGEPPAGWQALRPARPGHDLGGNTILWLPPDTQVILRPATPGVSVTARVLVIPGSVTERQGASRR